MAREDSVAKELLGEWKLLPSSEGKIEKMAGH